MTDWLCTIIWLLLLFTFLFATDLLFSTDRWTRFQMHFHILLLRLFFPSSCFFSVCFQFKSYFGGFCQFSFVFFSRSLSFLIFCGWMITSVRFFAIRLHFRTCIENSTESKNGRVLVLNTEGPNFPKRGQVRDSHKTHEWRHCLTSSWKLLGKAFFFSDELRCSLPTMWTE